MRTFFLVVVALLGLANVPHAQQPVFPAAGFAPAGQQEALVSQKLVPHNLTLPSAKVDETADVRGIFSNPTATPLIIISATCPLAHQVVFLQPQTDATTGFVGLVTVTSLTIPAHHTLSLGAHQPQTLRLQGLAAPLEAGMETPFTLTFEHGTQRTFRAIILN